MLLAHLLTQSDFGTYKQVYLVYAAASRPSSSWRYPRACCTSCRVRTPGQRRRRATQTVLALFALGLVLSCA